MASRSFIGGFGVDLYIDMSDLVAKMNTMRDALSEKGFERLMTRTFNEVGRRMKTPIAQETVKKYAINQTFVKKAILPPIITTGPHPVVRVPLKDHKGSIGGRFRARARRAGAIRGRSVKGKIVTQTVRGVQSILPDAMWNQGGNPPFMARGVVFTRRTEKRFPIVSVKGLAVPQMPLNLAASETQDRILEIADERLEHNFKYMFGK